jgi:hypothetical protein
MTTVKDQHGLVSAVKANELILTSLQNKIDNTDEKISDLLIKMSIVSTNLENYKETNSDGHRMLMEVYKDLAEQHKESSLLLNEYNLQLKEHMCRTALLEHNRQEENHSPDCKASLMIYAPSDCTHQAVKKPEACSTYIQTCQNDYQ